MKKIISLFTLLATVQCAQAHAQVPFQASLTPEVAIYNKDATIGGLALNVWGENEVRGLDLGFVNVQKGDSAGLTWSLLGGTVENYKGVILGGFYTRSTGEVLGWQSALVNFSDGELKGLQSGLVNFAQDVTGVQFGLFNCSQRLNGVQVGLVNVVAQNSWFRHLPGELATGFPFINWSF